MATRMDRLAWQEGEPSPGPEHRLGRYEGYIYRDPYRDDAPYIMRLPDGRWFVTDEQVSLYISKDEIDAGVRVFDDYNKALAESDRMHVKKRSLFQVVKSL